MSVRRIAMSETEDNKKNRLPRRNRPEVNAPPFALTTKGKPDALQYTLP
jgi:hypothetical protein